ncbi:MAG: hypothetical protein IT463_07140 [Planctomycetes bacterium]|nr:hypothetical protein [Planctomycetota bacterium]
MRIALLVLFATVALFLGSGSLFAQSDAAEKVVSTAASAPKAAANPQDCCPDG